MTRWTKFCVRPPALYGARRSRRGLPEPSQTLKMAPKRPVTRDTVSISAKPHKCAARDGRIDRNGTVLYYGYILQMEACIVTCHKRSRSLVRLDEGDEDMEK